MDTAAGAPAEALGIFAAEQPTALAAVGPQSPVQRKVSGDLYPQEAAASIRVGEGNITWVFFRKLVNWVRFHLFV